MSRRAFLVALSTLALVPGAWGGVLDGVSAGEAGQALRDGLTAATKAALAKLGKENGYYANPQTKIGLPKNFRKAEGILRGLRQGRKVDDLVLAMNRAAELAIPRVEKQMLEAVKRLSVPDAKGVLTGGDQSATACFRQASEVQLSAELMPAIRSVAEQSGLSRAYHSLSATLRQIAGIESELATVENYVNKKALEGIYTMIGAEEQALRANPTQYVGGLTGKVFDLIKEPRS